MYIFIRIICILPVKKFPTPVLSNRHHNCVTSFGGDFDQIAAVDFKHVFGYTIHDK